MRITIDMARSALEMSLIVAFSTVYIAGHPAHRAMPLVYAEERREELVRAINKWLGPDALAAFPGVKAAGLTEDSAS